MFLFDFRRTPLNAAWAGLMALPKLILGLDKFFEDCWLDWCNDCPSAVCSLMAVEFETQLSIDSP